MSGQATVLPSSLEMEQELLGCLISTPEAMAAVAGTIQPEHFNHPLHARLYETLKKRFASGAPSSLSTLAASLHLGWNSPLSEDVTVGQYVARLIANAAPPMMVRGYAADLRDLWAARAVAEAAARTASTEGMPDAKLRALFDDIDDVRAALSEAKGTRETAADSARLVLEHINSVRMGEAQTSGATTGFADLDRAMLGYRAGELVVAGGRPGMGKTTFATSSLLQTAAAGSGVLFFSHELPREGLTSRLLADLAYDPRWPLTHSAVRSPDVLTDTDFMRLQRAGDRLAQLPFEIDYAPRLAVAEIGARVAAARKRMARRGDGAELRVVGIDYLKFLKATDRYRGQRVLEVGEITAGLLEIAKNEGVCILLLAQLNRSVEAEKDKRPDLHHLRESGDIEQDANVVMFLFREAVYIEKSPEFRSGDLQALDDLERAKNKLEVIIGKNRNGQPMTVDLFCDIGASAVRSLDWRHGGRA
ncbi:replicative DNA helicase [Xanthobacteraceae bacterium A53D]